MLLNEYLEKLRSFPEKSLGSWPREEQIALWINAFNAGVVKSIVDHYPIKSIMEIPGGWEQALIQVGKSIKSRRGAGEKAETEPEDERGDASQTRSLNQIEQTYLRRSFRDEKILFALCRGARGSPRLRQEAYSGPRLEGQLFLITREFVNDSSRNRIEPGEQKIVLSRLFEWYGVDFLMNWGNFPEEVKWNPEQMSVLSFFAHYLDDPKKVEFLREGKYKIKYEVFDWRLNDWKAGEGKS